MTDTAEYYRESPTNALARSGVEYLSISTDGSGKCTAEAHIHESVEFLYLTSGSFDVYSDEELFCACEGDLVLLRSNSIHRIYSRGNGKNGYHVFKVKPSVLLELADPDRGAGYIMRFVLKNRGAKILWRRDELEGSGILSCVSVLIREVTSPGYAHDVAMKTGIVSLLVEIMRDDSRTRDDSSKNGTYTAAYQIYKAVNYINANYKSSITAADCAAEVNMSYSYFSRTFKNVTGISFKAYLADVRINHAERELLLTDKSVTEVAYECGFSDVSYFIAQYKAHRGCTPHKFRREY